MSDITNLVYNGDFTKGTSGWNFGSQVEGGILTRTGDLNADSLIRLGQGSLYQLDFEFRYVQWDGVYPFYIALYNYDSARNFISIAETLNRGGNTTLASALNNGDTTVQLTSSSGWLNGDPQYARQIGICNNLAWKYNRSIYNQYYASISGNTFT